MFPFSSLFPSAMTTNLTRKESEIVSLMKTFAILGVVLIHAPKLIESAATTLFSRSIPTACVPLFFILSGYFLLGKNLEILDTYRVEIRKRLKTLLVPFLFWNAAVLLFSLVVLWFFPTLSNGGPYTLKELSAQSIVSALLGINRYPISYQFWFIRNLMLFVLASFFFRHLLIKSPWLGLALAVLLEQKLAGAGYFYLGGIIAVTASGKIFIIKNARLTTMAAITAFALSLFIDIPKPIILCMSFALITGLANIEWGKHLRPILESLSGSVFFIFATHEPMITVTTRLIAKIVQTNRVSSTAEFFIIPFVTVLLSWSVSVFLRKKLPALYGTVTGSR